MHRRDEKGMNLETGIEAILAAIGVDIAKQVVEKLNDKNRLKTNIIKRKRGRKKSL